MNELLLGFGVWVVVSIALIALGVEDSRAVIMAAGLVVVLAGLLAASWWLIIGGLLLAALTATRARRTA